MEKNNQDELKSQKESNKNHESNNGVALFFISDH